MIYVRECDEGRSTAWDILAGCISRFRVTGEPITIICTDLAVVAIINKINEAESKTIDYVYDSGTLSITGVSDRIESVLRNEFPDLYAKVFNSVRTGSAAINQKLAPIKTIIKELLEPSDKFKKRHEAFIGNINDRKSFVKLRDALIKEYSDEDIEDDLMIFFDKLFMNMSSNLYCAIADSIEYIICTQSYCIEVLSLNNKDDRVDGVIAAGDTQRMFESFNELIEKDEEFYYEVKSISSISDAQYFVSVLNKTGNWAMLIETRDSVVICAVPLHKVTLIRE